MTTVVLANLLEFNHRTLASSVTPFELAAWDAPGTDLADLALFWGGDDALVVLSADVNPLWVDDIVNTLGFRSLRTVCATSSTTNVCADVLRSPPLFRDVESALSSGSNPALAAWGPTPQLGELARRFAGRVPDLRMLGLPPPDRFWLSYQLDSKVGFRHFVQQSGLDSSVKLPEGFVVPDFETALGALDHFASRGVGCALKTAHGTGGFGVFRVPAAKMEDGLDRVLRELRSRMRWDSRWRSGPLVIEELVEAARGAAAPATTADFEVADDGSVSCVGSGTMRLRNEQFYTGVLCGRGALNANLAAEMEHAGRVVGAAAAASGYRGLFDLDFVMTIDGALVVTEMNARRASPSHAIIVAELVRGNRWRESGAVLSNDHCILAGVERPDYATVREAMTHFRRSIVARNAVVIPTIVSHSLRRRVPYMGYVMVADDAEKATAAARSFETSLRAAFGAGDGDASEEGMPS